MKKVFLATGAAPSIFSDLNKFSALIESLENVKLCAVGVDAIYPEFIYDYFCTYHPEDIKMANNIHGNSWQVISYAEALPEYDDMINIRVPHKEPSGGSALLAVIAAKQMGFEKVILCGCPLIGNSESFNNYDYAEFRVGWEARFNEIKDITRSMSGWTKELLGEPTKEWLEGV